MDQTPNFLDCILPTSIESQIETLMKQRLERNGVVYSEFNFMAFEVVLLDGTTLVGNEVTESDKSFLEKFVNCKELRMSRMGLKSLKNLPYLPKLEYITLEDNMLLGDDLHYL